MHSGQTQRLLVAIAAVMYGVMTSTKQMHETLRLSFEGAVDADGHILEPPDLWEKYLEPKYRDRALRIVVDENGLEELEIFDVAAAGKVLALEVAGDG